jgi:hypothetical protein
MFAEIFEKWTPNLWKIVYCPRDWVTIINIQHNVYSSIVEIMKFLIVEPYFLK